MSTAAGPLVGRRILIVEDEYLIAEAMEEWLSGAGAKVVGPVPSVEQAFELIEEPEKVLDGAVLDVNLGRGETAYPVADRLNERGVPYLFATGDVRIIDDPGHRKRLRLEKPLSRQQLVREVERLVSGSPAHPD
ncbi:CheY chemotaxis protein or a CheY-like REC (receiver) domain [Roseomonas rosea]|jgi:CheY-like chemotaxis protein|uniref:CheY chemotaxis protein or a CheY-like REC (Receiver) domain n=1 Tax=Muricoccus roseus TaxID=198092 RepID=A0A1M6H7B4_9PROT|nr:response regulator [Roseomonas rosea]SHJ18087.1 CheY chemotaxis protein or a CheY-like REC (receiver) domain [Roseomonas rosea]